MMGCCCGKQTENQPAPVKSAPSSGNYNRAGSKEASERSVCSVPSNKRSPSLKGPDRSPPAAGESAKMIYVALWDYKPDSDAELSLKAGDRVRMMTDAGGGAGPDWIFAMRIGEKCGTGYVPRAFVREEGTLSAELWYFSTMSRRDVEKALRSAPEGTFIVRKRDATARKSKKEARADQRYALSVKKKDGQIKHYPVWCLAEKYGGGYFLSTKRKFASLADLVDWYKRDPTMEDIGLIQPASRTPPRKIPLSMEAQKNWREIPRAQITLLHQVGKGNFGIVYAGTWKAPGAEGGPKKVAVKALKKGATGARLQFIKEAVAMKNLCHKHLVQLYGVVSTEEPFWIIQEFVKDGSLLKYLQARKQRGQELREYLLVDICRQIASGMQYLEEKHLVHRDLAARNVLVDVSPSTENVLVKIADFGLAKLSEDGEVRKHGRKKIREVPTKWTAPEALQKGTYSSKSDVWSFGVVLHEVFTHGKEPYELFNNAYVRKLVVQTRQILRRDSRVPERAYDIMKKCFNYQPTERPTFKELHAILDTYCDDVINQKDTRPSSAKSPPRDTAGSDDRSTYCSRR